MGKSTLQCSLIRTTIVLSASFSHCIVYASVFTFLPDMQLMRKKLNVPAKVGMYIVGVFCQLLTLWTLCEQVRLKELEFHVMFLRYLEIVSG